MKDPPLGIQGLEPPAHTRLPTASAPSSWPDHGDIYQATDCMSVSHFNVDQNGSGRRPHRCGLRGCPSQSPEKLVTIISCWRLVIQPQVVNLSTAAWANQPRPLSVNDQQHSILHFCRPGPHRAYFASSHRKQVRGRLSVDLKYTSPASICTERGPILFVSRLS